MESKVIYIATSNPGKLKEIELYAQSEYAPGVEFLTFKTLNDLDENIQKQYNPVEDGDSFLKNSLIKARALYNLTQQPCFGEDSGLEVDALGGAPGIYSSRYAKDDPSRISKLLTELKPYTNRSARFITSICFIDENGNEMFFHGKAEGEIIHEPRGGEGFGYDPVFYSPEARKTFAQISSNEKQNYSHRGKALKKFFAYLQSYYI